MIDMMIDIVMQGPLWDITPKAAEYYLKLPFINNIIISTWENETIPTNNNSKIIYLKNKKPRNVVSHLNIKYILHFD